MYHKEINLQSLEDAKAGYTIAKIKDEQYEVKVKEDVKEEVSGPGKGAPSSGSNYFTLMSFPTEANPPFHPPSLTWSLYPMDTVH